MRSLIRLLVSYHAFLLFAGLEILCAFLIVENDNYYQSNYINAANTVTGGVYERADYISSYFGLRKVNDSLNRQIAVLLNQPSVIYHVSPEPDSCLLESDTLVQRVESKFKYIAANVIRNSVNTQRNYIFLDKGSKDGIKTNMGVVNQNGVVGIVSRVSENYALVMSLLHRNAHFSSKLDPGGFFGNLHWDGKSIRVAKLTDIPLHAEPKAGDKVVTSGYSAVFPAGINIGRVLKANRSASSNFLEIQVELGTNFGNLNKVMVIQFEEQKEIKQLEEEEING